MRFGKIRRNRGTKLILNSSWYINKNLLIHVVWKHTKSDSKDFIKDMA